MNVCHNTSNIVDIENDGVSEDERYLTKPPVLRRICDNCFETIVNKEKMGEVEKLFSCKVIEHMLANMGFTCLCDTKTVKFNIHEKLCYKEEQWFLEMEQIIRNTFFNKMMKTSKLPQKMSDIGRTLKRVLPHFCGIIVERRRHNNSRKHGRRRKQIISLKLRRRP